MTRILLVGAFGFIGKQFLKKYHKKYCLIAFGKKTSFDNFPEVQNLDINTDFGDVVEDMTKVISRHKPDVVLHLSALTGLTKCNNDPKKAFLINVNGIFNVIQGCVENNSRLIFFSSREVYGETLNEKTKETDPLKPNNVYGITKLIGEEMIKMAHKKLNLSFTILRLTNVYGPEGDGYGSQIIIKNALKGSVDVLGGSQRLNFVYVDDVVDLISKIIDNPISINEIYNIGSNDTLSIKEFVNKVLEHFDKVKINYKPMRQNETSNFVPDLEKIQNKLGFKPKTDIETGIRKTIEWYSKEG